MVRGLPDVHFGMGTPHARSDSNDVQLPLVEVAGPAGIPIGKRLWLVEGDGQRAVFLGATAIHVYDADGGCHEFRGTLVAAPPHLHDAISL